MPEHWGTPGGTIKGYTLSHTTIVNTMIDLICGGVVERYPRLKFVVSEYETGWLAHVLQRLDHAISAVYARGEYLTPDQGGQASTETFASAVIEEL